MSQGFFFFVRLFVCSSSLFFFFTYLRLELHLHLNINAVQKFSESSWGGFLNTSAVMRESKGFFAPSAVD